MTSERISHLTPSLTQLVEKGEGREREKMRGFRVRSSHFSLVFWAIGLAIPYEARQSWSPLQDLLLGTSVVEFRQLWEVGVFILLELIHG